jgi:hypothetical protein
VKFYGSAIGGTCLFDKVPLVVAHLRTLEGQRVEVTFEKHKKRRSLKQNKRQWSGYRQSVKALADYSGHTEKELHEFFKEKFCPLTEIEVLGEKRLVKSTALLNTAQHNEYMERVAAEMAQHGIDIYPERRTA